MSAVARIAIEDDAPGAAGREFLTFAVAGEIFALEVVRV